jgi:hypothetical protein
MDPGLTLRWRLAWRVMPGYIVQLSSFAIKDRCDRRSGWNCAANVLGLDLARLLRSLAVLKITSLGFFIPWAFSDGLETGEIVAVAHQRPAQRRY